LEQGKDIARSYSRWQFFGLIAGLPVFLLVLFAPRPEGMSPEAQKAAAVCALMVLWWVTEAVPIPVTALLPLALFPLLGVLPAGKVAASYGDRNIYLFLGGFFMAVTMEKWNLHRRIALSIISLLGTEPRKLILGFMVATAFLSMWISNTATTMMMLPIGLAVIYQFDRFQKEGEKESGSAQALMLSIAYAASIGGIGTLIGTPPNIIFVASFRKLFPEGPEITFVRWFFLCFPLVLLFLPIIWFYLTRLAFRIPKIGAPVGEDIIASEMKKLGPMSRAEKWTLGYFVLLALGWIFRRPITIESFTLPGWSSLLGVERMVHDSTVAIFVALLLFVTPVQLSKGIFLLDWRTAVRIPWGILILFGGGIALADGFSQTGLAHWIADSLTGIRTFPFVAVLFIVALLMVFLTEVTSNTAIATIFMPILAALAVALGVNPIGIMIIGTIASSLAFMLPVATPPNAIVFGSGRVRLPVMARVGLGLNFIGTVLVILVVLLLAGPVFGIRFHELPAWAQ